MCVSRLSHPSLTLSKKHLPTNSGQSVYCSNSLRKVLVKKKRKKKDVFIGLNVQHSTDMISDHQMALRYLLWKW